MEMDFKKINFYKGKMAKISPKLTKIEIKFSGSQRWALLPKVPVFGPQFWLNFNFGYFRAYSGHFSLVKIDFFKIHFHLSKKKFGKNKNHPQFLYHINQ